MVESLFPGDIIHEQCSNRTSVIRPCYRSEIFLSRSVPNLQFDIFIFNRNGFSPELNPNGNIMRGPGLSFNKLKHNTWFTNTSIPNNNELKQVMVRIHYLILNLILIILHLLFF